MSDDRAFELASEVIAAAAEAGLRIAVAESLTGGMLAAALVAVPGASRVFSGGVVAYDSALKASLLRVDRGLLSTVGPVDARVAESMARGVRDVCGVPGESGAVEPSAVGVSTTGVAGPDPDVQTGQPAGTVWIGVSSAHGDRSVRLLTDETSRSGIREATVEAALGELLAEIQGNSGPEHR